MLILIDIQKNTKKCQKSDARESILSRFYFKVIKLVVSKIRQNKRFQGFAKI